jgi:hypothetical protein
MTGGVDEYTANNNYNLIFSEKNSSEDEITRKIEKLMRSRTIYENLEKNSSDDCEKIKETLFHLIHNANDTDRGNSNAYGVFQISEYKAGHIAHIAICDGGEGISGTIEKKFQSQEVKPYFAISKNKKTFYYIIEALFWRKRMNYPFKHGLYHVAEMILKKGGSIAIHSDITYSVFSKSFLDIFNSITHAIDTKPEIDISLQNVLANFAENRTMTRKYKGVHIDIEIPIGRDM